MNKAIKLATLFSSLFLTTNALAADEVWSLTTDLHLNGEVIGTSESLDARIHQGHFILTAKLNRLAPL